MTIDTFCIGIDLACPNASCIVIKLKKKQRNRAVPLLKAQTKKFFKYIARRR